MILEGEWGSERGRVGEWGFRMGEWGFRTGEWVDQNRSGDQVNVNAKNNANLMLTDS